MEGDLCKATFELKGDSHKATFKKNHLEIQMLSKMTYCTIRGVNEFKTALTNPFTKQKDIARK